MRFCFNCKEIYTDSEERCPKCNTDPVIIDGFEAFAPDLAKMDTGFNPKYYSDLAALEADNFWFKSRNSLIIWAIKKYAPSLKKLMEVGCGTGFVLGGIAKNFPSVELTGSEIYTEGLFFAKKRVPKVKLVQMDARKIPFIKEFDVIGAFDVLEHIDEDLSVLKQLNIALSDRGVVILTVPQHGWLWSELDDCACHVRRYDSRDLHQKIHRAGFDILRSTSFVSVLLPLMWMSRFLKNKKDVDEHSALDELRLPSWQNYLLSIVMKIEIVMIRIGFSFPIGGSRLVVARKQ